MCDWHQYRKEAIAFRCKLHYFVFEKFDLMPINKNASFRYRILDQCFGNHYRRYTLSDLVETVSELMYEHFGNKKGVCRRTIQADIHIMRSMPPRGFGAPIICDDGFYFYEDEGFSIQNAPLNVRDMQALIEISQLMQQFDFLPHHKMLRALYDKLMLGNFDTFKAKEIVHFEVNKQLRGLEMLPEIYQAVRQGMQLQVQYKPFQERLPQLYVVSPYLIREYNNRWFLIGTSNHREGISVFGIDRIENILLLDEAALTNSIDIQGQYDHVIGVSVPEQGIVEDIVIKVSSHRMPYLLTKPLHKSQEVEKVGDDFIVTYQLILTNDILTY